jgi:hypothetical protein
MKASHLGAAQTQTALGFGLGTASISVRKRDLLLDLTAAGRRRGLHLGIYYSLYEWYHPLWLSDRKRYVAEHISRSFEGCSKSGRAEPGTIFSDGEGKVDSETWRTPEMLATLPTSSPVRVDKTLSSVTQMSYDR